MDNRKTFRDVTKDPTTGMTEAQEEFLVKSGARPCFYTKYQKHFWCDECKAGNPKVCVYHDAWIARADAKRDQLTGGESNG
jgi:hypothetical protein